MLVAGRLIDVTLVHMRPASVLVSSTAVDVYRSDVFRGIPVRGLPVPRMAWLGPFTVHGRRSPELANSRVICSGSGASSGPAPSPRPAALADHPSAPLPTPARSADAGHFSSVHRRTAQRAA